MSSSSFVRKFTSAQRSAATQRPRLPRTVILPPADARKRATLIARYRTNGHGRLEDIAHQYMRGGFMDESMHAEDFVSFADGVRFVNDLNREQHLQVLKHIMEGGHEETDAAYSAVCSNGSVFVLVLSHCGKFAAPLLTRFTVNDEGKVNKLWRRRGVLRSELEMLRDVEGVRDRMANMPAFHVEELPHDANRQDRMMRLLGDYLETFSPAVDKLVRKALVDRVTTADFQKWDATGVWEPAGGNQVLDREGLERVNGMVAMMGGPEEHHHKPGCTRTVLRGRAASATHNLGFMHMSFTATKDSGPVALDVMAAFSFTSDGSKLKQVMFFRNAMGMPEYAAGFKMASDISCIDAGMQVSG